VTEQLLYPEGYDSPADFRRDKERSKKLDDALIELRKALR
jgi:hypothetical protein